MPANQPAHVKFVGTDGRRYFTEAFKLACVRDILSGRARNARSLAIEHKLNKSAVRAWVRKYGEQIQGELRADAAPAHGTKSRETLLEKAVAANIPAPPATDHDRIEEEYDLAVAAALGNVSELAVKIALGRQKDRKFMQTVWMGRVFAGMVRSGFRMTR